MFYGFGIGKSLSTQTKLESGAHIFGASVRDPENYGVLQLDENSKVVGIVEKPESPKGDLVVPGMYFLDGSATERAKALSPSDRGEIEISDLLSTYLIQDTLSYELLPRGVVWLDMGTPSGLAEAGDFVRIIQTRQQTEIACLEEVALRMGFISVREFEKTMSLTPKGPYLDYLSTLVRVIS